MAVKFWAGCQIIFISTIDQGGNSALVKMFHIASCILFNCCTVLTHTQKNKTMNKEDLFVISVF